MSKPEYFSVHHRLNMNIEPQSTDFVLPDEIQFQDEIPASFVVANEFEQLDHSTERAKTELIQHELPHVVSLLETQNSKLNLLLNFMVQQQNDVQFQYKTTSFGASNFTYDSDTPLDIGTVLRVKLFLHTPAAAIYCYARVQTCDAYNEHYQISADYQMIRDADQDLLIKAALVQQQKLLRQRALQRDNTL